MSTHNGGMSELSMFDLFRMEVEGQAASLTQHLLDLETSADKPKCLEALMRASHSLKGAARMVGVDPLVTLTHVMEDCFVAAQKSQLTLTSRHVDLFLKATDVLMSISTITEDQLDDWYLNNNAEIQLLVTEIEEISSADGEAVVENQEVLPTITEDTLQPYEGYAKRDVLQQSLEQRDEQHRVEDRSIRINAERMTKILGQASELLVETRSVHGFTTAFYNIKRQQDELMGLLESWRNAIEQGNSTTSLEYQRAAFQKLDRCRGMLGNQLSLIDEYDRRSSNLAQKLYNNIVGSRMRPFADGITGFKRMVRDLSRSINKDVQLEIKGAETPVDRDVLEKLKAPLNHLLRNSLDHGVESIESRAAKGKPQAGKIILSATHGGGLLKVTVEDDGAGVDFDRLCEKLVEKGLVDAGLVHELSESELLEFLFLPDFSTRNEVTELSGRGVGLDVVRDMVRELGGSVSIETRQGIGTKFILNLPLTLSVISALLVNIASEPYAFPLTRVDRLLKVAVAEIEHLEGRQYIVVDGANVGLVSGAQVLGFNHQAEATDEVTVVIVSDRLDRYGIVVDGFIGQRQLSVQVLDSRLGKVPNVNSAALMEDGSPLFILDVDDLVRSIDHLVKGGVGNAYKAAKEIRQVSRRRILVVDDSLTVREVERDLLVGRGYQVEVAVDGMDGWNAVRAAEYDLVITDVDMPRMDGIELVKAIKHDLHLRSIPVMIVSYKDRPEDRRRGLEAGADYYLTKGSFHDDSLVEAVYDLIGEAQA